jgi:glycosyltransferase involved in cell wall biosynthesis
MSPVPVVSVVMSVYNGADSLAATLDSVLNQTGCDLEFIVVNDGSADESGAILDRYAAADPRLKVIHQPNAGLTAALIRGCAAATGQFIARQDADDLSLPGRLKAQSEFLRDHPETVVVAGTTRFVAPGGEWMFDTIPPGEIAIELDVDRIRAPSLVSTTFRRDAYLQVGGFRQTFFVAQDMDLWLRLIELGPCRGLPEPHYQARMTLDGISSRRREEQIRMCSLAIDCARQRRSGADEAQLLAAFVRQPAKKQPATARYRAAFHYFIASCLRGHDRAAARRYYRMALRDNPFHLKALLRSVFG